MTVAWIGVDVSVEQLHDVGLVKNHPRATARWQYKSVAQGEAPHHLAAATAANAPMAALGIACGTQTDDFENWAGSSRQGPQQGQE